MFFTWKRTVNRTRIQSQITDIVSHLDVDAIEVRAIAVESLATMINDYPQFGGDILKIIAKFIRDRQGLISPRDSTTLPDTGNLQTVGEDIQSALMVIGRRKNHDESGNNQELEIIDLSHVNLAGVNMDFGNFPGVNFYQTNFTNASLRHTNLQGAILSAANLSHTNLEYANLAQANLGAANLTGTNLQNADLTAASLYLAKLNNTDLRRANLSRTNLNGVDMHRVIMDDVESRIHEKVGRD